MVFAYYQHMDTTSVIAQAIVAAGGQHAVARAAGLSQPSVHRWTMHGLPATEWLPDDHPRKTDHATLIARMAGRPYTRKRILGIDPMPRERVGT